MAERQPRLLDAVLGPVIDHPLLPAVLLLSTYFSTALTNVLVLSLLLATVLCGRLARLPALLHEHPAALWALLLFLVLLLRSWPAAGGSAAALEVLSKYRELLLLPVFMLLFCNNRSRELAWKALVLATLLSLLVSFLMGVGLLPWEEGQGPALRSRITHSVFISFFLFYCAHRWLDAGSRHWLLLVLMLLCVANLFLVVGGRTGQLASVALLVLFAFQRLRLKPALLVASLLVVASGAFFLSSERGRDGVRDVMSFLNDEAVTGQMSMGLRLLYWDSALQLIGEAPLLGHGTGSFEPLYGAMVSDPDLRAAHPHNEPLFIGVQVGLLGLLVYGAFLLALWREARCFSGQARWLVEGLLLLLLVTSMFNTPFFDHVEGHWFALLLALCLSAGRTQSFASWQASELWLGPVFERHWAGQDAFAAARAVHGEVYRELEQRQTLAFEVEGREYFIKRHRGATWREIIKNLLCLRLPVVSARNEFLAIRAMQALGIAVPEAAAYGRRGLLPASLESFLVTESVGPHQSLEDFCRPWQQEPPAFRDKLELLHRLADISRTMHEARLCHRDYYLCHFLRRERDGELVLIDLHRALRKRRLGERWVIKDISGLWFSAMDIGLTQRDRLRFMRRYRQRPLREILREERRFWQQVDVRARKTYRRHHGLA